MAKLDNTTIICGNVKDVRKNLNLTQEEFAEKLNINAQFLSLVETGKAGISMDNAINICNTAKCSSTKLFKDLIKSPDFVDKYELLTDRDKSVINKIITVLLNTK